MFNRPTYKEDAEQHVCDTAVDQAITFVVAKLSRSGHKIRVGVGE